MNKYIVLCTVCAIAIYAFLMACVGVEICTNLNLPNQHNLIVVFFVGVFIAAGMHVLSLGMFALVQIYYLRVKDVEVDPIKDHPLSVFMVGLLLGIAVISYPILNIRTTYTVYDVKSGDYLYQVETTKFFGSRMNLESLFWKDDVIAIGQREVSICTENTPAPHISQQYSTKAVYGFKLCVKKPLEAEKNLYHQQKEYIGIRTFLDEQMRTNDIVLFLDKENLQNILPAGYEFDTENSYVSVKELKR